MFSTEQKKDLEGFLEPTKIKTRDGAGRGKVAYVEGWQMIEEANRVFGFGNWDAETIEMREIHAPVMFTPPPTRDKPDPKPQVVSCYAAKVRLTVWNEAHTSKCTREGWNAHRSFSPTVGEAVENAIKGAETDALKRAFRSFGNVFGLALYDKEKKGVGVNEPDPRQIAHDRSPVSIAPIDEGFGDVQPPQHQSNSQRALAASSRPPQGNSVQPDNRRQLNGSALPANAY